LELNISEKNKFAAQIKDYSDLILLYRSKQYDSPKIMLESKGNIERLLIFSRTMSWSIAFALIIKSLDRKLGFMSYQSDFNFPYL